MSDVLKDLLYGKGESQLNSIMKTDEVRGLEEDFREKQRIHMGLLKTDEEKDSYIEVMKAQQNLEKVIREELFAKAVKLGFNLHNTISE